MIRSLSIALLAKFAGGTRLENAKAFCELINHKLPSTISYPGSVPYNASLASYYSGQESQLQPSCIFSPTSAADVASFIKIVNPSNGYPEGPKIAVRSGGHMIWTGAANVQDGITIDMRSINHVKLSEDKTSVSLGAGGIWSDAYAALVPYNLTVMGGRVHGIGVGGLSLGGGINFRARERGWVCENIFNYELVTAAGDILNVNAGSYPDLWLALKGGSNNFGIITSIDAPTWEQGLMWGGGLVFNQSPEILAAQASAFSWFNSIENFDAKADMGIILTFQNPGGVYAVVDQLYYIDPVPNPPVYQLFLDINSTYGSLGNSLRIANISSFTDESDGRLPPGATRGIDLVFSFHNGDAEFYSELFQLWEDGTKTLAEIEGLQLVLLIQPHPVTNGTTSMGLQAGEKDLVMSVITGAYANAADDEIVQRVMEDVTAKQEAAAKRRGLYIPFQYLNYADKSQDPIASYGEDIKARLQAVSRNYDPYGFFQTQLVGGFKVFRSTSTF